MFSKRIAVCVAAISLLLLVDWWSGRAAPESWVSVRSEHLMVVGNTSEKDVRQIAKRLEQFHHAVTPRFSYRGPLDITPTTVLVFKNDYSYRPFKVSENNAGYFQPGLDVNYITLSNESRGDQTPFNIIFHEYTHLIISTSIGSVPPWVNEGMAEYYSTAAVETDRVTVGRPIQRYVSLLRQANLLPLRTLFDVDYKSAHYTDGNKQNVFYAESWALIHYLLHGNGGQRTSQFWSFLDALKRRVPVEQAMRESFGTTLELMENELRTYIKQEVYRTAELNQPTKLEGNQRLLARSVSEAEALALQGDLLFHSNREGAEDLLRRALQLDPHLAFAHGALGVLQYRQGRWGEALVSLERAAGNSSNHLVHYYYASVLSRFAETDKASSGLPSETAAKIRRHLHKAIELRPYFPDSYNLLAYVNLISNTQIDETIELIKQMSRRLPGRIDFTYMLGQLYMHKDDYKEARPLLKQVLAGEAEDKVHRHVEKLLATIARIEEQQAQREADRRARGLNVDATPAGFASQNADPSMALREVLRVPKSGESQVLGRLISIECENGGLVFVVRTIDRILRLRTETFQQIQRTTFTEDVRGTLTCGKRKPENAVVVCYLPSSNKEAKIDGVLRSVEFVPSDFTLAP